MLVWAAVYAGFVIVAFAVVAARREPTIVRGDWIFLWTAVFILAAASAVALRGGRFSLGELLGTIVVLTAGWVVQSRWWVVGAAPAAVIATIEECASRLCAPSARTAADCSITVPGGAVQLRVAPAGRSTVIQFRSSAKHRKAQLFRRLLAKQYRSAIPTLRVGGGRSEQGR